jgi:YegS/Rv2252/BmrU family lipid kinase
LPRPVTLIVNGQSRRGREAFAEAQQVLRRAGVPLGDAILSRHKQDTVLALQREVEAGAATVIIGGGDGTLSYCASRLVNTSVAMAVLPLGTGNTLARSLGIPLDLDDAARTIGCGHVEKIDVGRVNGRVFLNSVTLGLSANIAHALNGETKKRLGVLAWPVVGAKVIWRHRAMRLRVVAKEKQFRARSHQIVISNGRYIAGPVAAAPDASIQDSCLRVFTLGRASRLSLFKISALWIMGRHVEAPDALYFTTQSVRIDSLRQPLRADVDGEICERTPLSIEVMPKALSVVVPRGFEAATI